MKKCQTCGFEISENAKFCGACGSVCMPKGNICGTCNTESPENAKFCGTCGNTFLPQSNVCKGCGAELQENIKFCGVCGTACSSIPVSNKPAYKNDELVLPPVKKKSPVFWIAAAAGIAIVFFILNPTGGNNGASTTGNRGSAQSGVLSGGRQSQLRAVNAPPATHVTCWVCNGTGKISCIMESFCGLRDPWGGNSLPNSLLPATNPFNNFVGAPSLACQGCRNSGSSDCLMCDLDKRKVGVIGVARNPEYGNYLSSLINLAQTTGMRIFSVQGSQSYRYIGIEYCVPCEGSGIFSFPGVDSAPCPGCNRYGILLTFLSSYNSADLNRSIGTRTHREWSMEGTQRFIQASEQRHQESMDRRRQITDEYHQRMHEIHDNRHRPCARHECNGFAETGSSFCFLHEGSSSNSAFCAAPGCSNRRYSSVMYCGPCRGGW